MDLSKLIKQTTKGQGSILVPHIDAYLDRAKYPPTWDISIPNYKPDDGLYHPSSHTFETARYLYFDRLGARQEENILPERKISPSLARIFACGHMWHGYIGNILVDMGFIDPKHVEIHFKKEIETEFGSVIGSGTVDLLDVEIPGQGKWLVDMKTVNSAEFIRGIAEYTMMKWEAQVNCYGDWADRDKMMILAIEKDSPHRLMEFQIRRNKALLDKIYMKWVYTELCIQGGEPPDCDHEQGEKCGLGKLCSYYVEL